MGYRYLSIHAHFYQPPREDPLTGVIPIEAGAAPFQNWNERIHAECYRPNAELGNFEQISFNIGPTLFAWMEQHDPSTCRKIVAQDKANQQRFGAGNAIAQAYNHTILPLATRRDKQTQVAWGVADFVHRFGKAPTGMWLPETAVDLETLEVLADAGIRFTILAPWQAAENIDSGDGYHVRLSAGQEMAVFFYQRELSTRISFDPAATVNADHFAETLLEPYFQHSKTASERPPLLLLASDGELYGHHQDLRHHFLARLVDGAARTAGIQNIYPALWLERYPPRETVSIQENTSWSCHHGIERWRGQCACVPDLAGWKAPMRFALDRLADELEGSYLELTSPYIRDPHLLRNRYIHVILGELSAEQLIHELAGRALPSQITRRIHLALEAQRERQRMFTSCGWFYDDFDRIEPRNNLAYAAQAVHLTYLASGLRLADATEKDLMRAVSPRRGITAAQVFYRHLQRAQTANDERIGYAD